MVNQLIQEIFHQTPLKIEKLEKGLTNQNFLVTLKKQMVVCRIPYPHSEHIVNYQHEQLALKAVSKLSLDVKTLYYNVNTGVKITEYVENCVSFQQSDALDKFARVGKLMAKLHQQAKPIGKIFDPIQTYQRYKSQTSTSYIDPALTIDILDFIVATIKPTTLCHNDWVPDNILLGPHQDYLIDYEYAGDNDPIFDVTSFLSENNITDPIDRKQFFDAYYQRDLNTQEHLTLLKWEAFHHMLWCSWAIMMFEQRKKAIYQQIAYDKQAAFNQTLQLLNR